jgi:putative exporter of polyketide antibiotics
VSLCSARDGPGHIYLYADLGQRALINQVLQRENPPMAASTRFLSRLIGLYCLIAALAMASHRETTLGIVASLVHDEPLLFIVGILTLLGGLAWILAHNKWTGGSYAVLITILGWLTLLKGVLELSLPHGEAPAFFLGTLHYARLFYLYMGFSALIGAYLCYGGFRAAGD